MNRLLIIDALNLIRRMHATQPDESDMNALCLRLVSATQKLIKYHSPTHLVFVWEGSQESWRKELYQDYKKGRKPMPEALTKGLEQIKNEFDGRGWHNLTAESEADDAIATLATKLAEHDGEAVIVSTDAGFSQLLHPSIKQWDHYAQQYFDVQKLEQKYGVEQNQFLEFWALAGSSGNKIPGIAGIGPKSAAELLKTFRSIANIYNSLDTLGEKQAKKLADGKEMARISYKLSKMVTNSPLKARLSDFRIN
ncbi:flap endonuclease Xni [Parashewanella tropica]|uniref:flap endonuclease Xni n=1 Tax=Parashewanella tropica TaxID=2547970 RepID=UPI00105956E8|nr:flap endonuclease Xni [Parashewanella tropica]